MNKINLVLDLDETLINTLQFNFNNNKTTNLDFSNNSTIGIINLPNYLSIVFLRPYLKSFLVFCYKYFNVSFWTAGSSLYCKEVLKLILTEDQYENTQIILAKEDKCYIELKTNKVFYCNHDLKIGKDLSIIWEDDNLGFFFRPNNTLIIDDNSFVINENPQNSVRINPFSQKTKDDRVLCQLSNWLNMCKDVDDVRYLDKELVIIPDNCSILEI